jgi:hypothetical protein
MYQYKFYLYNFLEYLFESVCVLCVLITMIEHMVASVARHKSVSIVCVDWDSSIKRNVLKWTSIITSSFSVDISEEICIATAKMGKHVIRYCFRSELALRAWQYLKVLFGLLCRFMTTDLKYKCMRYDFMITIVIILGF